MNVNFEKMSKISLILYDLEFKVLRSVLLEFARLSWRYDKVVLLYKNLNYGLTTWDFHRITLFLHFDETHVIFKLL